MRDSGGLRSAACPPSNRLFCVGLSLHELKRKKTLLCVNVCCISNMTRFSGVKIKVWLQDIVVDFDVVRVY